MIDPFKTKGFFVCNLSTFSSINLFSMYCVLRNINGMQVEISKENKKKYDNCITHRNRHTDICPII